MRQKKNQNGPGVASSCEMPLLASFYLPFSPIRTVLRNPSGTATVSIHITQIGKKRNGAGAAVMGLLLGGPAPA